MATSASNAVRATLAGAARDAPEAEIARSAGLSVDVVNAILRSPLAQALLRLRAVRDTSRNGDG